MCIRDRRKGSGFAVYRLLENIVVAGCFDRCIKEVNTRIIIQIITAIPVSYTHLDVYKRQVSDKYQGCNILDEYDRNLSECS